MHWQKRWFLTARDRLLRASLQGHHNGQAPLVTYLNKNAFAGDAVSLHDQFVTCV
jgi:hypothetical protein